MADKKEILTHVAEYIKAQQRENADWDPESGYVNYAGPYFDEKEIVSAVDTLLDGWLVMGNKCQSFERKFPREFGKEFGILTNSGSSSNLLMIAALTSKRGRNFKPGTKVLMPIAGFPTTLNPTIQYGFEPIFVDIELDTLNIDLDHAEEMLREHPDIRVITFAHVLGNPPNMDRVMQLVEEHGLVLLEDCCDALGSTYDSKPLGSFGEMASCSFYPAHHITLGEGGFVACKDKQTEDILRSFREWGRGCYCVGPEANKLKCGTCKKRFSNWIPALPDEIFDHKYVYDEIGYNLKPIEVQGAMGLEQLKKLNIIKLMRNVNYATLRQVYQQYADYFYLPDATEKSDPSWFAFPLTIKPNAPFTRAEYVDYLEDNRIQTRPYFAGNIMMQPAYSHLMDLSTARDRYPNATHSLTNTFFHGTSPVVKIEQLDYIANVVNTFMARYR